MTVQVQNQFIWANLFQIEFDFIVLDYGRLSVYTFDQTIKREHTSHFHFSFPMAAVLEEQPMRSTASSTS